MSKDQPDLFWRSAFDPLQIKELCCDSIKFLTNFSDQQYLFSLMFQGFIGGFLNNPDDSRGILASSSQKDEKEQIKQIVVSSVNFKQGVRSLQIYKNTLYVGTTESKVLVYEIIETQLPEEPFKLKYLTKIYPHCTSALFIVAVEQFLVIIPHEEQQLIRIWDRSSLKLMHGYKGHEKQISKVIFLKNGQYIASASHDASARIWNIYEHDQFDKEMIKYEGSYPLLALEEIDDVTLALGGDSCFISLWNWKQNEVKCKVFGHPGSVQCLSFYHPYLVSSGGDSKLKIWDIREAHTSSGLIATNRKMQEEGEQRKPMLDLILQKEIKGALSQHQFFFKLTNYQVLIVDSTGNVFYINSCLQVKEEKIDLDYFRKIRDIKIWNDYMLFFPSYEAKEKKHLHGFKIKKELHGEEASGFQLDNALQLLTNLLGIKPNQEEEEH